MTVFLVLAIHEVGHLLGGWFAGFRALLLVVGPVKLERRRDGWAVGFNRVPALWGGLAASAPTDTSDLQRRTLRMVVGGPLTSLAVGALGVLLWWLLPLRPPSADSPAEFASLGLVLLAVGSLGIGVVTLVPATTSGFPTDGAQILRQLRGGPEAKAHAALQALVGLSLGGARPRDWPHALVEQALELQPDTAMGLSSLQMAHVHALDHGRISDARGFLELALASRETLPGALRPGLLAQGAYFAAAHDGDPERARRLLEEVKGPGLGAEHLLLLAEVAVRLGEGDDAGARERVDPARARLHTAIDAGTARAQAEWLDHVVEGGRG